MPTTRRAAAAANVVRPDDDLIHPGVANKATRTTKASNKRNQASRGDVSPISPATPVEPAIERPTPAEPAIEPPTPVHSGNKSTGGVSFASSGGIPISPSGMCYIA